MKVLTIHTIPGLYMKEGISYRYGVHTTVYISLFSKFFRVGIKSSVQNNDSDKSCVQNNGGPVPDIMYGHTYSKYMNQPCKVAHPARGQLNRENELFHVCVVRA